MKALLTFLSAFVTLCTTNSFSLSEIPLSSCTRISGIGSRSTITGKALFQSSSSEDGSEKKRISHEQFLEESSREGYQEVKSMSIEERARRAMLAEAAEDRVVLLSDKLELLLGEDGMPKTVEDREEVAILAAEIKSSMQEYENLVNGKDCPALDMFNLESSSSEEKKTNGRSDFE